MNTLQLEAMDRNCELPEVIFATSPHPLAPTCTGVGGEMLAYIEAEYIELADIRNEWKGRSTIAGQQRLCRLRDLICKATGRDSQDVQDDYGNRNLTKNSEATP
jgi:hypothetical protein